MMKRSTAICIFALTLSLLAGCRMAVTSPMDEEFRKAWDESMEEVRNDLREDLEDGALIHEGEDWPEAIDRIGRAIDRAVDGLDEELSQLEEMDSGGKQHRWQVLDADGAELCVVTDEAQVKALDDLLCGDEDGWDGIRGAVDGEPLYTYVYWQEETPKAGRTADGRREYEELLRFKVYGDEDAMEMSILPNVSALLPWDDSENGLLSFSLRIPPETAAALRDPSRFQA